jgi:hypothetical protein
MKVNTLVQKEKMSGPLLKNWNETLLQNPNLVLQLNIITI